MAAGRARGASLAPGGGQSLLSAVEGASFLEKLGLAFLVAFAVFVGLRLLAGAVRCEYFAAAGAVGAMRAAIANEAMPPPGQLPEGCGEAAAAPPTPPPRATFLFKDPSKSFLQGGNEPAATLLGNCQEGNARCRDPNHVEICSDGNWKPLKVCNNGQTCQLDKAGVIDCGGGACGEDGKKVCIGDLGGPPDGTLEGVYQCTAGLFRLVEPCYGSQTCELDLAQPAPGMEMEVSRACKGEPCAEEGKARCALVGVEVCTDGRQKFSEVCPAGQQCQMTADGTPKCLGPPCQEEGVTFCNQLGDPPVERVETCREGNIDVVEACAPNQACVAGSSVFGAAYCLDPCTAAEQGTQACNARGQVVQCDGSFWQVLASCAAANEACVAVQGACPGGQCPPGANAAARCAKESCGVDPAGGGPGRFVNVANGETLDQKNTKPGDPVLSTSALGGNNQQFQLVKAGDGYKISSLQDPGVCINAGPDGTVSQGGCGEASTFQLEKSDGPGGTPAYKMKTAGGQCLTTPNPLKCQNNSPLVTGDCNNDAAQFYFLPNDGSAMCSKAKAPGSTLDEVTFLGSHNAMNNPGDQGGLCFPPFFCNQSSTIEEQLNVGGARSFDLDLHPCNAWAGLCFCHAPPGQTCVEPTQQSLCDVLTKFVDFLTKNPAEVLILHLEDYGVSGADLCQGLAGCPGVNELLADPGANGYDVRNRGWPTLDLLQKDNKRLWIFNEDSDPTKDGCGLGDDKKYLCQNNHAGTKYMDKNMVENCECKHPGKANIKPTCLNGPCAFRCLNFVNHYRDASFTCQTNQKDNEASLNQKLQNCAAMVGFKPNVVNVDCAQQGDAKAIVDQLNAGTGQNCCRYAF